MKNHMHIWVEDKIDYEGVNEMGEIMHLKNVPAEVCSECDEFRVSLDELQRLEQRTIAGKYDLKPEQITPLLLLYAPYPKSSFWINIPHRFKMDCNERMHKMLFYLWKRLDKIGYEDAYIMDEFVPARSGPVAAHLKEMCRDLRAKKLMTYKESKNVTDPFEGKLERNGKKIAMDIWEQTPEEIRESILSVKKEFLVMDIKNIIEKVHKEHPGYIKEY